MASARTKLTLEQLLLFQTEIAQRIARAIDNLKKLGEANITRRSVEVRLESLQRNWADFKENHIIVLSLQTEAAQAIDYFTEDHFSLAEESFLKSVAYLTAKLDKFPTIVNANVQPVMRKMPDTQIPTFSGKFTDWLEFKDLFTATIIQDSRLSNAEKLQQLKLHVQGEAADMIKTIQLIDANFELAWRKLESHYTNTRRLISMYTAQLLDISPVTSESPHEIKSLLNNTQNALAALEQLQRPTSHWDDLLISLTVRKLDQRTFREWESSIAKTTEPSTFKALVEFLTQKVNTLEAIATSQGGKPKNQDSRSSRNAHTITIRDRCVFCSGAHFILSCTAFRDKSTAERRAFVSQHNLCFNCLGFHKSVDCRNKNRCRECAQNHHTLLHDAPAHSGKSSATVAVATVAQPASISQPYTPSVHHNFCLLASKQDTQPRLIATALVQVRDGSGVLRKARALIDPGSEITLVQDSLCKRLNLPRIAHETTVDGVGGIGGLKTKGVAQLTIHPLNDTTTTLECSASILPILSKYRLENPRVEFGWPHLAGLQLADSFVTPPNEIEILLGVDVYAEIILKGLVKGPPGTPLAQNTIFGWILSGRISSSMECPAPAVTHNATTDTTSLTPWSSSRWMSSRL